MAQEFEAMYSIVYYRYSVPRTCDFWWSSTEIRKEQCTILRHDSKKGHSRAGGSTVVMQCAMHSLLVHISEESKLVRRTPSPSARFVCS